MTSHLTHDLREHDGISAEPCLGPTDGLDRSADSPAADAEPDAFVALLERIAEGHRNLPALLRAFLES